MLETLWYIVKSAEQKILSLPSDIPEYKERLDRENGNVIIFLKCLPSARRRFLGYNIDHSTSQYFADLICEFFGFIRFSLRPDEA